MDFAGRSEVLPGLKTHRGADAQRISGWPHESHAQSGLCSNILEQLRWRAILSHHQISASVSVEIRHSRSALFPIDFDAGILAGNSDQLASPVVSEPYPAAGVQARRFRLQREKILTQKHIFVAISVKIRHVDCKTRRELCPAIQFHSLKSAATIKENH